MLSKTVGENRYCSKLIWIFCACHFHKEYFIEAIRKEIFLTILKKKERKTEITYASGFKKHIVKFPLKDGTF